MARYLDVNQFALGALACLAVLGAGLAGCSSSADQPTGSGDSGGSVGGGIAGASGTGLAAGSGYSGMPSNGGGAGASPAGGSLGTAGAADLTAGASGMGGGETAGAAGSTTSMGGSHGGGSHAGGATGGGGGGGSAGAGGSSGSSGAAGGGGSPPHTGMWHIMPLGDSITGNTCYPQLLSKELISKGHTNFNFIGMNLNNQGCGAGAPNLMTEGHGGYDVTYLLTNSPPQAGHGTLKELQTWAAEKPDVVLMQYGTNDVWGHDQLSSILSAYSFVVDQFRSQIPNVIFFVAQITPMHPSGCSDCESNVEGLNSMIPSWAAGKASAASPIYVVNAWSALPQAGYIPNSQYTSDGVHPNPTGSQLMADVWTAALTAKNIP